MADARGAVVSRKTIALAAIEERMVTFTLGPDWKINGFVCGMDDYHWKVVDGGGNVHLIHKSQAVVTIPSGDAVVDNSLSDTSAWTDEQRAMLRPIIAPFKEAMERERRPSPQDAQGADA